MGSFAVVWIVLATIVFFPIVFYGAQAFRLRKNEARFLSPMMKLVLSGLLLVLGSFCYLASPGPWWLPPLRAIPYFYSLLLSYSANIWIATGVDHRLSGSNVFRIVTLLTIIVLISGYASIDNLNLIFGEDQFINTPLYYLHYGLTVGILMYITSVIIGVYRRSLRTSRDLTYLARRYIGLFSLHVVFMAEVVLAINFATHLLVGDRYRDTLNGLFFLLVPGFGLIPLANMFPQHMLRRMVRPFEGIIERREKQEQDLLRYLHEHVTTVVPKVRLLNNRFLDLRLLIEIEDARDIFMSWDRHLYVALPRVEAEHIWRLLQRGTTLNGAGTFPPPRILGDSRKYLLSVARRLQTLEQRAGVARRVRYD